MPMRYRVLTTERAIVIKNPLRIGRSPMYSREKPKYFLGLLSIFVIGWAPITKEQTTTESQQVRHASVVAFDASRNRYSVTVSLPTTSILACEIHYSGKNSLSLPEQGVRPLRLEPAKLSRPADSPAPLPKTKTVTFAGFQTFDAFVTCEPYAKHANAVPGGHL
jgi:hypothetical protein